MASTNKQHHHLNYLKTNLNTLPLEKRIQLIEDKQQISDTSLYRYAAGFWTHKIGYYGENVSQIK